MGSQGSIVKRGKVFYFRFRKADGKYTMRCIKGDDGIAVTVKGEAERIAKNMRKDIVELESVKTKTEYLAKVAEFKNIISKRNMRNSNIWQEYLNNPNRPDSGEFTLKIYHSCLNKFLSFVGDNKITSDIASEYMFLMWKRGITSSTYNKHLQALKLIFKTLLKEESPFVELKAKPLEQESRKPFTIDQINKIFDALNKEEYYMLYKNEMRILLLFGLCFGLRLHDASCFKWEYIKGDVVEFKPLKTQRKMKSAVILPIPLVLQEELNNAKAWRINEYVLPNVAKRYNSNATGISQDIVALLEHCNISTKEESYRGEIYINSQGETKKRKTGRYSFHSFRHTFCSIATNNGNDLNVVRSIVGHSNVAMTEHYTHYDMTVKKNVIDSVASKALLINSDNQFKLESIISNLNDTNKEKVYGYLNNVLTHSQKLEILAMIQ